MFEWIKTFIAVYETKILVRHKTIVYFSANCFFCKSRLEQHFSIKLFYRNGKQSVIPTKEADFISKNALDY